MSPDQQGHRRLLDLVDAFAHTSQAVLDLARTCTDNDLGQPTECPGWTVHDQIAHVAGVEARLGGHKDPRIDLPQYEHIKNDLGKRVEYAVEVRRGRTGADLVEELELVLAQRLSTLRSPNLTQTSVIPGPFGPDQAETVLLLRTFDIWTHEQDIRSALGRPGNLDSPAAAVCVGVLIRQLPKLVAKNAGVEPGTYLVIEVTGPLVTRCGVRVEVDEQGRPRGRAVSPAEASGAGDGARASTQLPGDPATTISLSTEAFTRRAAGRRSVSDTAYRVVGDDAVAQRVLEALVVTH